MTFIPQPPFGTGAPVPTNVDLTVANFGATNFPHSPNFAGGLTSTATRLLTINAENVGTTPPSNAGTT